MQGRSLNQQVFCLSTVVLETKLNRSLDLLPKCRVFFHYLVWLFLVFRLFSQGRVLQKMETPCSKVFPKLASTHELPHLNSPAAGGREAPFTKQKPDTRRPPVCCRVPHSGEPERFYKGSAQLEGEHGPIRPQRSRAEPRAVRCSPCSPLRGRSCPCCCFVTSPVKPSCPSPVTFLTDPRRHAFSNPVNSKNKCFRQNISPSDSLVAARRMSFLFPVSPAPSTPHHGPCRPVKSICPFAHPLGEHISDEN